jgi:hypothetical protein
MLYDFFSKNYEWLFSGLGIISITICFEFVRKFSKKVIYNKADVQIQSVQNYVDNTIAKNSIIDLDLSLFLNFKLTDFLPDKESTGGDNGKIYKEMILSLASIIDEKFPNITGSIIYKTDQIISPIAGVIFSGFGFGNQFGSGYSANLIVNISKNSPKFVVSNGLFLGDFIWDNKIITTTQELNIISIIKNLGLPELWVIKEVNKTASKSIFSSTSKKKNLNYNKPNSSHCALEVYATAYNVDIQNTYIDRLLYRSQNFFFKLHLNTSGELLYIEINRTPVLGRQFKNINNQ